VPGRAYACVLLPRAKQTATVRLARAAAELKAPRRALLGLTSLCFGCAGGGVQVRESITGAELRQLVVAKFGRSYDTRLCQRRDRFNKLKMAR
jgi:hypothetical protein